MDSLALKASIFDFPGAICVLTLKPRPFASGSNLSEDLVALFSRPEFHWRDYCLSKNM